LPKRGADGLGVVPSQAGLSTTEALARLAQFGPNELSIQRRTGWLRTLVGVVREPMVLLLVACSALYFSLGDLREALILLGSIVLVVLITLVQERKTERALQALKELSSPRASVMRDGRPVRIAAKEVVPGDLLLLDEGDRIPADALLVSASALRVDESLLTGESVPVGKREARSAAGMEPPGKEHSPCVYASTLIVGGHGRGLVQATGSKTEVGKIGRALQSITAVENPLQRQIAGLVRVLAILAGALCITVVLVYGLGRLQWRTGFLAGLTLAMSLIPEEFPVVITVFLALGAYRMARRQVLTRRLAALESLGAATILCADKTGTLTENRMRVVQYVTELGQETRTSTVLTSPADEELGAIAALACPPHSFDPVDNAAVAFGESALQAGLYPPRDVVVREYPLSPALPVLAVAREWNDGVLVAAKGAPEAIARLCGWGESEAGRLTAQVEALAANGLRLLAVANSTLAGLTVPERVEEIRFKFLGLIALADPLRPGIREAVSECQTAGIRVAMITGDHPATALAIARQAGIDASRCLTGAELERMSGEALRQALRKVSVFARVVPLHKLRLVESLRSAGEIVAMTGDGVNDAPALRAAHIGIAMGGRGTDVAREAADLVVLDDNFVSIVGAIRTGRRIWANLQKSLSYVLAVHVPIAGMALIPLLLGWPMLFTPVHIVFLELIIDPACSIAFEMDPEEDGAMRRPPRRAGSPLIGPRELAQSIAEGMCVLVAIAVVFWVGLHRHAGAADARSLAFTTLILGNLGLIWVNRSRSRGLWAALRTPNPVWWAVVVGALGALAAALSIRPLRSLFQFSVLHPDDLAVCAAVTVGLVALLSVIQRFGRSRRSPRLAPTHAGRAPS
jgi:P-type Ca2+ transporter type 2C